MRKPSPVYVDQASRLTTYTAVVNGGVEGVCLVQRHTDYSAEIYLLAVKRSLHRRGLGRARMAAVEADLRADGFEFVQVKTLGTSHPSVEYATTRRF